MNFLQSRKSIMLFAIIGILVIVVAGLWWWMDKSNKDASDKASNVLEVKRTVVPNDQIPEKFPAGIPIEKDAQVTQNYTATDKDGQFIAVRVFITQKSLEKNYEVYTKWFNDRGWTIESSLNESATLKAISAKKADTRVQITLNDLENLSRKTVSITVHTIK